MAPALLLLLMAGCERADEPARAYLAALSDPLDPGRCAAIAEPVLAAECTAWSAQALARAERLEEALAVCEGLAPGTWRDECFFLVADATKVSGAEARQICGQAGRFHSPCIGHAINRDAMPFLSDLKPGQEPAALVALERMLIVYMSGGDYKARAWSMLRDRIAGRTPISQPFSAEICGAVSAEACQDVYAERLRRAERSVGRRDKDWRRGCPGPATPAAAAALGLHPWTEDAAAIAAGAWAALCG